MRTLRDRKTSLHYAYGTPNKILRSSITDTLVRGITFFNTYRPLHCSTDTKSRKGYGKLDQGRLLSLEFKFEVVDHVSMKQSSTVPLPLLSVYKKKKITTDGDIPRFSVFRNQMKWNHEVQENNNIIDKPIWFEIPQIYAVLKRTINLPKGFCKHSIFADWKYEIVWPTLNNLIAAQRKYILCGSIPILFSMLGST